MPKKATIYDVARAAHVSPATVSRVLNHPEQVRRSTSQTVYAAIHALSFDMRALQRKEEMDNHTTVIRGSESLLLLLCLPSLSNPFYSDIMSGAQRTARRLGHHLLIYETSGDFQYQELQNLIRSHGVSGLIMMDVLTDSQLRQLNEMLPIVQCSEYNKCSDISYVSIDNMRAAKQAVDYILSTGRTKVALLSSSFQYTYAEERRRGYEIALYEAGIPMRQEYIVQVSHITFEISCYAAMRLLRLPEPPDAIFAVSDTLAAAAVKTAAELGFRVPDDLTIVGFDNTDVALTCTPALTTIGQPRQELGSTAVHLLLHEIENPQAPPQQIILNTDLIIRQTSKNRSPVG